MKFKWITGVAIAIGTVVVLGGVATAQEKDRSESDRKERDLGSNKNAVELTLGTGYAQGVGNVASGEPSLTDIAHPGGAVQIGVGYRLLPQLTLGLYGSGAMFGRGDQTDHSTNLYSTTAGVEANWHFLPAGQVLDPWVSLGSGWRGYWMDADRGTTAMHGIELAKLQVGLDYRLAEAVAISPVIGADLSTFVTRSTPERNTFKNISDPNVNAFLFAGAQGRFDIPTRSDSASHTASR
jgi:hypothetical protein